MKKIIFLLVIFFFGLFTYCVNLNVKSIQKISLNEIEEKISNKGNFFLFIEKKAILYV